jgi:hypothetical protein
MRGKTRWEGPTDARGLPLNATDQGGEFHFPTTLFQKALGHWDCWLEAGERGREHETAFRRIADWAVETQDVQGGWPIWPLFGMADLCPTAHSAISQGHGISVLTRAFALTRDAVYRQAAKRAAALLLLPIEQGGTSHCRPEGLVLEEGPWPACEAILNGWIFGLFGLYDLQLADETDHVSEKLEATLGTLTQLLAQYDAGFWSWYDLSGHLASPTYHQLHQAQLQMLSIAFPHHAPAFDQTCKRFAAQSASPLGAARAFLVKSWQKLREPPVVVMREAARAAKDP